MSAKLNLKMKQGSTFRQVLRWESSTKVYATISGITKAAPAVVTAVAHGLKNGWRAKITNVLGMKEINDADTYHIATNVTTDTVTFNDINALDYTTYISGGVIEYNQPVSLSGATARMHIRAKLASTDTIEPLTTEDGDITIDDTEHTITITLSATKTAGFSFTSAVYSLEIIQGSDVTEIVQGTITLDKEVTR